MQAGTVLGDWEILERIGEGGLHEVWSARRTGPGGTSETCALKTPRTDEGARFLRREHELLDRLHHPNVVHPVELVAEDGDALGLALRRVRGETLRTRLERAGSLPIDEVATVLDGLVEALAHVHARGFCHGDLKPENVIIEPSGRPILTDFDLGRAAVPEAAVLSGALATRLGGTAPYLSPEQLRGEAADATSDVWALGLCLFEMLCGELPQPGDDLAERRPETPRSIVAAFRGCWTRRSQRFRTGDEVRWALKRESARLELELHEDRAIAEYARSRARAKRAEKLVVATLYGSVAAGFLAFMVTGSLAPWVGCVLAGTVLNLALGVTHPTTDRCPVCDAEAPLPDPVRDADCRACGIRLRPAD